MSNSAMHRSHTDITKRLRRAEGHLRKIVEMIAAERDCLDVAQQLQAVENAVNAAKKALILDHLDHCLDRAFDAAAPDARGMVDVFRQITKYL